MVVGYQTYIDLVRPWLTTQEVVATGMKAEVKRCQLALDRAGAGQRRLDGGDPSDVRLRHRLLRGTGR